MKSAFLQKGITKAEQSMAKQLADSKGGTKPDFDYDNPNVYLKSHDATSEVDKKKGIKRTKTVEALQPLETSFISSGSAGESHRTDSQLEKSREEYEVPIPEGEEGHEWKGSKEIIITAPKISEKKKTTLVKQSNRSDGDYTQLPESRVSLNRDERGNVVRGGKPLHDFYKGPQMKGSPAKQGVAGGGIRGKFLKTEGGKKHWSKK